MNWWEGSLAGFDLETTGPNPETARIVTANVTFHRGGDGLTRSWDLLVDPGVDIPAEATAVHHVTTQEARENGVPAAEGLRSLLATLTSCAHLPFVAYNGVYDFTVVDRECRRYGMTPFVPAMVIDPIVLDRHIDRYRPGPRKLIDAAAVYGVVLDNAHSADADALAAVLIARAIGQLGKLTGDPVELHELQIGWYAEQQASLEKHLQRKGTLDGPLERTWPVHPFVDELAGVVA